MNMLQTSGFITKSREIWWKFAERNVSFETSSPSLFAAQPSFVCQPEHQISFFFPRLHNFRDFRRSSGSIVSLWTKGSSPWESWRNWRFFGAYNWLKNGPRMKMSTLSLRAGGRLWPQVLVACDRNFWSLVTAWTVTMSLFLAGGNIWSCWCVTSRGKRIIWWCWRVNFCGRRSVWWNLASTE